MKVQVNLKVASQSEAISNVSLDVFEEDNVQSLKERVVASQMVVFPNLDLLLEGQILKDEMSAAECGVKHGSSLDLVIHASEETLAEQLSDLLQARDLTCDELALMYCYKHGVSIKQALRMVGHSEKLQEFVTKHKGFSIDNGKVALVRSSTSLKPFSAAAELQKILEDTSSCSMDITALCSKFTQKFNVSLSSVVNMRPAEFLEKEKELFVVSGRGQVSLRQKTDNVQTSVQKSENTNISEKSSGKTRANLKQKTDVLAFQPERQPENNQIREKPEADAAAAAQDPSGEEGEEYDPHEQYMDLHNKISGRSFNSKIAQILNDVVDIVQEKSFLNIVQVVKGGSVGKGTAIAGTTDAAIVFFLKGLPYDQHSRWLPALLKAMVGVLTENLDASHCIEDICTTEKSVHMKVKGLVEVDLHFAPAFESYTDMIEILSNMAPEMRQFFSMSLMKEEVHFISKQPGQVKVTMRLLKWWRDQQDWSCTLTRPTDRLLELIAVYSALQTKPKDQRVAIANAMSLMARFDEMRIVWSNYYSKDDIWAPLLNQRPLLMDPVNPFINVADPQAFDARELISAARTTHFFW